MPAQQSLQLVYMVHILSRANLELSGHVFPSGLLSSNCRYCHHYSHFYFLWLIKSYSKYPEFSAIFTNTE